MQSMTGVLTYPALVGFYRRRDGEEYVVYAEDANTWHITNGITDDNNQRHMAEYLRTMKRVDRIDLRAMRALLEKYRPGSPVLGMI